MTINNMPGPDRQQLETLVEQAEANHAAEESDHAEVAKGDEYEAAMNRLEHDAAVVANLERKLDADSLRRAADLTTVFEDGRWATNPKHRGNVDKFTDWVKDHPRLGPAFVSQRTHQLLNAERVRRAISTRVENPEGISTEYQLRPLARLLKHRANEIPDVWARTTKRTTKPSASMVADALAEYEADRRRDQPKPEPTTRFAQYRKTIVEKFDKALPYVPSQEEIEALFGELADHYNAYRDRLAAEQAITPDDES